MGIKIIKCHYPTKTYYGHWHDGPEPYNLYEATDSNGVVKTFLSARKAWAHARS